MVGSRTLTAGAGIAVSIAISVLLWYQFGTAVFFLFVPFVPFLFRGFDERPGDGDGTDGRLTCPTCGFQSADPTHEYCPRDGTRLD